MLLLMRKQNRVISAVEHTIRILKMSAHTTATSPFKLLQCYSTSHLFLIKYICDAFLEIHANHISVLVALHGQKQYFTASTYTEIGLYDLKKAHLQFINHTCDSRLPMENTLFSKSKEVFYFQMQKTTHVKVPRRNFCSFTEETSSEVSQPVLQRT